MQMMGSVNTQEEAFAQLDHYRSAQSTLDVVVMRAPYVRECCDLDSHQSCTRIDCFNHIDIMFCIALSSCASVHLWCRDASLRIHAHPAAASHDLCSPPLYWHDT